MSLLVSRKRSEAEELVHYERHLLGLAFNDVRVIDVHADALKDYVWIDEVIGKCWNVMASSRNANEPYFDRARWQAEGLVESLGGISEIKRLKDGAVYTKDFFEHARYAASKLLRAKQLRALREICDQGYIMASSTVSDPDDIRAQMMRSIASIDVDSVGGESISDLCLKLAEPADTSCVKEPATTGMFKFDTATGGFRPGEMIILAARPSIGKSAIAAQWALSSASRGKTTIFISLEMKSLDVAARVVSSELGLPMRNFRDGTATDEQRSRVVSFAKGAVKDVPLVVIDKRNVTVDAIGALVRSYASKKEVGLVVVDYIGLITPTDRRKQRWESITEISNQLKSIALAENVPMLVLCQLTRDAEGEAPKLSHLRESGSIEQDADMVLLLHRANRMSVETELIIAKNRNGECATLGLEYLPTRFKFQEVGSGEAWNG